MQEYPTINHKIRQDINVWVFDKSDGSQIRAEWNNKNGFYKFGTRHQLINEQTETWGKVIPLIRQKYERDLSNKFRELGYQSAICFFEFYGPSSFAGNHNFNESMDVVLFDLMPHKQNLLPPKKFFNDFGHLHIPSLIYQDKLTEEIIEQIRSLELPNISFEGVVCKGLSFDNDLVMFKIKTNAWLNKLRHHCKDNEELFQRLI